MTFDPHRISYDELLAVFWSGQPIDLPPDPNPRVHLAVMPLGGRQLATAEASLARLRRERRTPIHVDVVAEPRFVAAETMHQKFYLQRGRPSLVDELAADFPDRDAFLASTAAARLNAWLTPLGDEDDLRQAAEALDLDPAELRRRLRFDGDG